MKRESISSIEFKNLSLKFDEQEGAQEEVFSHVDFSFPMNKIIWLKGESGAGRSLLIKLLNGLIQPTSGDYLLNSRQVKEMSFEEFLPFRLNIGYSFDFGGLINNRSIYSNLILPLEYHREISPVDVHMRVTKYMHIFNLQKVAAERPSAVVGGLRKAGCVARAFIMEPELLLLDDPTTGLRGETSEKLKTLILDKLSEGSMKHVIIASDDEKFMNGLNPVVVEVKDKRFNLVKNRDQRGQAA